MRYVASSYVDLPACVRCGGSHTKLAVKRCDPDGPGRLRAKETHEAVCPKTGWKLYFQRKRKPETGPTFRLFLKPEPF